MFKKYFITTMSLILLTHSMQALATNQDYQIDEYLMNPMSKYMTKDQFKDFITETSQQDRKNQLVEGKVITINTRDSESCEAVRREFNLNYEVCNQDINNPLVSVVIMRNSDDRKDFERKIDFSRLGDKEKVALDSLKTMGLIGGAAFGLIYAMPESVSKWDKSKGFTHLASQYKDRVKAGPIMDKDDWAINYIGHPVSGAYYYTMVRHQGFSKLESAAFSFFMSTFFWEYGIESIAEVPSIQDLILTPLLGSILGEVFYNWANIIEDNNGKLFGSTRLGATATLLMNPAGAAQKKINSLLKHSFIKKSELSIVNKSPYANSSPLYNHNPPERYIGLQLKMTF